ncbi:hypothetical protein D3874_23085 [Oleomonas cavernae]|uniref:Uncharacterized protein n=1 Tax=Oleomonas cavernae TaxID=2320859 RepID=A0A418WHX2_9PROT|nr:hypothetical protein D3874_23085 [Oleomonas cavernae]
MWLWVLVVAAYFAWGVYSYSGLYKMLAQWQIREWGSYQVGWTALVPGFLLAGPALSVLGRRARVREAAEAPHDPAARTRRALRVILPLALVSLLAAAGAYYYSTTFASREAPPATVTIAALGAATPPDGAVILVGEAQAVRTVALEETISGTKRLYRYVPIVKPGAAATDPIRFFLKTNATHYLVPGGRPQPYDGGGDPAFAITTQTGVLIANGLPGAVEALYGQEGIALARPYYYVLDLTPEGARAPFYIAAALGGFLGLILLVVALAQWRLIRRLSRT